MRVFFFTMHRSGSMVLHRTLMHAAQSLGVPLIAPNVGGSYRAPLRQLAEQKDAIRFPNAFICGALRGFIGFPDLDSAQALLHIRDPRDVLVSMFFSYCYSHKGAEAGGEGHRREVAERGIDWFALEMSEQDHPDLTGDYGTGNQVNDLFGNVRRRYRDYQEGLADRPSAHVIKYEDMILDPDRWIDDLNAVLGLEDVSTLHGLIGVDDAPTDEDKWAHRRQATPGDFRRKLKPGTIDRLNDLYAPALERFGYAA